ncbi:protein-glutamine glutaminase family protein [Myxococcus stipitatus]|uniref:protein-glutamine glutaminase family protein n=1 Tax=Myxococcus stipitatus TaxID=83455 RepID=UPI0030D2A860
MSEIALLPSRDEVDAAVRAVAEAPVINGMPMAFHQLQNNCQSRAQVAMALLLKEHPSWAIGKIFITGGLHVANQKIQWGWHVAPFVLVRNDAGLEPPQIVIVDPAFEMRRALSLDDWIGRSRNGEKNVDVKIHLRGANVHYMSDPPDSNFSSAVDSALKTLREFAEDNVHNVDRRKCGYYFVGLDRGSAVLRLRRRGVVFVFRYREDVLDGMKAFEGTQIPLCATYDRVPYARRGLMKLWPWEPNYLSVKSLEVDGSPGRM